MRSFY